MAVPTLSLLAQETTRVPSCEYVACRTLPSWGSEWTLESTFASPLPNMLLQLFWRMRGDGVLRAQPTTRHIVNTAACFCIVYLIDVQDESKQLGMTASGIFLNPLFALTNWFKLNACLDFYISMKPATFPSHRNVVWEYLARSIYHAPCRLPQ